MIHPFSSCLTLLFTVAMLAFPLHAEAADNAPSQGCLECHARIVSTEFLHGPLRNKECGGCHKAGDGAHPSEKGIYAPKASGSALCFSCHDRSGFTRAVRHSVVDSCSDCHLVHGSNNEHLLKDPPQQGIRSKSLCYSCHDTLGDKKTVHSPVKLGSCTLCHFPHSSRYGSLLKATGSDLCFRCHDREPFTLDFPHKPVEQGKCDACHLPHQSDSAKLLKTSGSTVICVNCHDRSFVSGTSVHKPAAAGECRKCHATHSSNNRKLLIRQFPEELVLPYDEDNYAACFKCHASSAFSDESTTLTRFRRGASNLHRRHVQKFSCQLCHDFHSSSQMKLVRTTITAPDKSTYSISFVATATGGSCTTSCHEPRDYSQQ